MPAAIVSVTNDLVSDQRVDKVCNFLTDSGFEVCLVGRRYRNSPALTPRRYRTKRLHLLFRKGKLFYAEFALRLFFFLLFKKCNVLVSNDLDTLLPNFLVSRLRKKKLVYDSHEYFCGVPELVHRPRTQAIWRRIERFCFPKLETVITVSQSIADLYDREYPRARKVLVVHNFPTRRAPVLTETRASLGLPEDKNIVIMQGALNVDRGAEELVAAMPFLDDALLLLVGDGDKVDALKRQVSAQNLSAKVRFVPRIPPEKLYQYTALADVGCSLEKDTNVNYRFCMPNKLFDYFRAGIPVVVADLPEMSRVVRASGTGLVLSEHSPQAIAAALRTLLTDRALYRRCQQNTAAAAERFCWENELAVLKTIYSEL